MFESVVATTGTPLSGINVGGGALHCLQCWSETSSGATYWLSEPPPPESWDIVCKVGGNGRLSGAVCLHSLHPWRTRFHFRQLEVIAHGTSSVLIGTVKDSGVGIAGVDGLDYHCRWIAPGSHLVFGISKDRTVWSL